MRPISWFSLSIAGTEYFNKPQGSVEIGAYPPLNSLTEVESNEDGLVWFPVNGAFKVLPVVVPVQPGDSRAVKSPLSAAAVTVCVLGVPRSEERRVGKGCRW